MTQAAFQRWADDVRRLASAVDALAPLAAELGAEPLERLDWHGSLVHHLLPQLAGRPCLIAAVMGGTNTGKSMIYNQLAGWEASGVDHRASRTRHPVCILPADFPTAELPRLFGDFALRPWQSPADPLADGAAHVLWHRHDPTGRQPAQLLLLDTPDIDGSVAVNWDRARLIRQAADVVILLLTNQKYNDWAVTEFCREAAAADKPLVIVWNMVRWPAQQSLVRELLDDFLRHTSAQPLLAYAVPDDEAAGRAGELPFHSLLAGGSDLRRDLAEFEFAAIKRRTFAGSLRQVLDEQHGLPAWLRQVRQRAGRYAQALELVQQAVRLRAAVPPVPGKLVADEIWRWLAPRRTKFDRLVHRAYGAAVDLVRRPFVRRRPDAVAVYQAAERQRLVAALAEAIDQLAQLEKAGGDVLASELGDLLGGLQRQQLFDRLAARHAELPLISDDYRQFILDELDCFERDHPGKMRLVRGWLVATAVLRPAITIALLGGPAVAHELAAQAATATAVEAGSQVAAHSAMHVAFDVALGTTAVAGSETAYAKVGQGAHSLVARIFTRFYEQRGALLAELISACLLGSKLERLSRLAAIPDGPQWTACWDTYRRLAASLPDRPPAPANCQPSLPATAASSDAPTGGGRAAAQVD